MAGSGRNRLAFADVPVAQGSGICRGGGGRNASSVAALLKPLLRSKKSLALYELLEKKLIPVLTAWSFMA